MKYTLKHRLVGAAVLAAIAVLFLPSFFKEKQVAPVSTKTMIPQRPGTVPVEFNAPQPVPDIEPAPAPEAMFAPDGVAPSEPPSHSASSAAAVKEAAPASPVSAMPLNAQGLPDAWVVQVGSFATKEAANKIRDDLQAEGLKAYVRTVPGASGMISRVYIGPKLDKAQAQQIKAQIDKRLKVNSIITHFQP